MERQSEGKKGMRDRRGAGKRRGGGLAGVTKKRPSE